MDNENDTLAVLTRLGNPMKLLSATLNSSFFTISKTKQNQKVINTRSNNNSNALHMWRVCNHCSIIMRHACHFSELHDSRLFQLFDLLLDHVLKGLEVYEPWQFSSTVLSFILSHLFINVPVDCNGDEFVNEKKQVKTWLVVVITAVGIKVAIILCLKK